MARRSSLPLPCPCHWAKIAPTGGGAHLWQNGEAGPCCLLQESEMGHATGKRQSQGPGEPGHGDEASGPCWGGHLRAHGEGCLFSKLVWPDLASLS